MIANNRISILFIYLVVELPVLVLYFFSHLLSFFFNYSVFSLLSNYSSNYNGYILHLLNRCLFKQAIFVLQPNSDLKGIGNIFCTY